MLKKAVRELHVVYSILFVVVEYFIFLPFNKKENCLQEIIKNFLENLTYENHNHFTNLIELM